MNTGYRYLLEFLPPALVGETPGHMVTTELIQDIPGDFCSLIVMV